MRRIMMSALGLALSFAVFAGGEVVKETVMTIDGQQSSLTWTGKKVTGSHTGNVNIRQGNIVLGEDGMVQSVYVQVDMTTISNQDLEDESTKAKLVGHLKSDDFFGVEKFPYAEIKLSNVTSGKEAGQYVASGTLTVKGKTEPISVPFKFRQNDGTAQAMGKFTFDRSKYDVRYGSSSFFDSLGDKVIYDDVEIEFNIIGQAKSKK